MTSKKQTDLVKKEGQVQVAVPEGNVAALQAETLISQAITSNVPVETLERLLIMRKDLKAEFAKEEFDKAMAKFQRECPTITKNKSVFERDGKKVRYKFASLDSIVEQVKQTISDNGLSYTIRTKSDDKMFTAIIRVAHIAGHAEESEFSIPISSEQFMSDVQKFGARSTFAKRYAFLNAFGIMTGDEDAEKNIADTPPQTNASNLQAPEQTTPINITKEQMTTLHQELGRTGKKLENLLAHLGRAKLSDLTYKEANTWIISLRAIPDDAPIEGEIEEMPPAEPKPKAVKPAVKNGVVPPPTDNPGPMHRAWEKSQQEKAKKEVNMNAIPEDVCQFINLYEGVPETDWPVGLKELVDDCNAGLFKGKVAYPNLF